MQETSSITKPSTNGTQIASAGWNHVRVPDAAESQQGGHYSPVALVARGEGA